MIIVIACYYNGHIQSEGNKRQTSKTADDKQWLKIMPMFG